MADSCKISIVIFLLATVTAAQTEPAPPNITGGQVRSSDPEVHRVAVESLRETARTRERYAATAFDQNRLLDVMLETKDFDAVAEIALHCVNGQPDRLDRIDYFMQRRIRALLSDNRPHEALAAAKSYYNVCAIASMRRCIELMSEALDAAYPNKPGKAKRFRFQQLAGADGEDDPSLGTPVLAEIKVDPSIYTGEALKAERSGELRRLGQANLLLLQDKPAEAKVIFESLAKSSRTPSIIEAANESLARVAKAIAGHVGPGNEILKALAADKPVQPAP
jgi:hypothetical protein